MRRLDPEEAAAALARAEPIAVDRPPRHGVARLEGRDPQGDDAAITFVGPALVVFCSTTCEGCADLASLVAEGVVGLEVVGALRAPASGLPDPSVSSFTSPGGRWVLGDDAFEALGVHAAPFFSFLDASGSVVVEGVPLGRAHVEAHAANVLAGTPRPDSVRLTTER